MRALLASGFVFGMSFMFMPLTCEAAGQTTPAPASPGYVDGSLCMKPDQIVLSCPLEKSNKIVSICVASANGKDHFYYSFGKHESPELTFPPKNEPDKPISSSQLGFSGASGGIAYSFISGAFKYIVYHISGTGFENGGLMVVKDNGKSEVMNMKCKDDHIVDGVMNASGDALHNKISHLHSDQEISKNNLPFAPKN